MWPFNLSLPVSPVWPSSFVGLVTRVCIFVVVRWLGHCHHENMPIIFGPLKPHFYIVNRVYRDIHYFSYFAKKKKKDCGYSLKSPRQSGSNEYRLSMFYSDICKISQFFLSENFKFLEVKFSIYLNTRVFVMFFFVFRHYPYISKCDL